MIVAICITNAKMNNWVMKKIKRIAAMLLGVIAISMTMTACGAVQSLSHDEKRGLVNAGIGIADYYGAFD